jgi:hypothetical protein
LLKEIPEWEEIPLFSGKFYKENELGNGRRVYNLERKHRVVSITGNILLITVSGTLLKKRYPS